MLNVLGLINLQYNTIQSNVLLDKLSRQIVYEALMKTLEMKNPLTTLHVAIK
jgi:hypothetical protein